MEPSSLVSGVHEIYDPKTTNAKKDAAQNEIQNAEKAGRTVPFLDYLFRYADNRTEKTEAEKIATGFRTMSNEFSRMQRSTTLLSVKHAQWRGAPPNYPRNCETLPDLMWWSRALRVRCTLDWPCCARCIEQPDSRRRVRGFSQR